MRSIVLLLAVLGFATVTMATTGEKSSMGNKTEFAVLGGGCFWCMEAVFEHVPGVKAVLSGYAGGRTSHPTYQEVCTGTTGHAEVVRIEFDPTVLSYEHLLDVFWDAHDPTTPDRQGADEGTQYRSIILYATEAQKAAAEKSKTAAQARRSDPIVTQIVPLPEFFPAEEYHQHYFAKNPTAGYCRVVIRPKVAKLQKEGVISE
ncbi:MAG: peptide-methionine (S)-S-oxide reductase MsrA [Opitutaceae bacterium]|nr:peptide-methionine (S)-S-oxide reductase MsrA [Opitutaceae bacterium]